MRRTLLLLTFLLLAASAWAQAVNVIFQWDASDSAATQAAANPVKYRLCSSLTAPPYATLPADRIILGVETALEGTLSLTRGTFYVFATAYWCGLMVDDVCEDLLGTVSESGHSNILKVELTIPPGNPKNYRIRTSSVAASQSGQTLRQWVRVN